VRSIRRVSNRRLASTTRFLVCAINGILNIRYVVGEPIAVGVVLISEAPQPKRIDEIHRVVDDIAVQVRGAALEPDRVLGGPAPGGGVVVAGAETD